MVVIIKCGKCGYTGPALEHSELSRYECMKCGKVNEILNVPLKEWLGFDFNKYLPFIIEAISEYDFKELFGKTKAEVARGKLNTNQITKLKKVLSNSFEGSSSIRDIVKQLEANVKVGDLTMENGRIIPARARNVMIARTESTRMANIGSEKFYGSAGIQKYSWVATYGERTCATCDGLNGTTYELGNGPKPPAHSLCRCSIVPEVKLL